MYVYNDHNILNIFCKILHEQYIEQCEFVSHLSSRFLRIVGPRAKNTLMLKCTTINSYLDLKKVFDMVNHDILL